MRLVHPDEGKAIEMVIEFARKTPEIFAVYRGKRPGEGTPLFYLVIGQCDFLPDEEEEDRVTELTDKITDLDIRIARETKYTCNIAEGPDALIPEGENLMMQELLWRMEDEYRNPKRA